MNISKEDIFYFGYIQRAKGLKGHLFCVLDVDDISIFKNIKTVFIELDKQEIIPFSLNSFQIKDNSHAIIKLESINFIDEANLFLKKNIYLPLDLLPKLSGNKFYFREIIGFSVIDEEYGDIGIIKSIIKNSAQGVFQILDKNNCEILIPAIDYFIKKIDRKNNTIYLKAPEGLIEFYRSNCF